MVADLLRPGGRLFLREGHPVLWSMSDPRLDGLLVVEFPYFETDGEAFSEAVTYAGEGTLAAPEIIHFNHGLGEIFNALWVAGLTITAFDEHREVPWNPFGDGMVASDTPRRRVRARPRPRPHAPRLHAPGHRIRRRTTPIA